MTRSLMKHTMSELSDLPVEALVDAERKKVTLRVPRVDSALIIDFVCRVLPDQGIVAFRDDNIKNAAWLTLKAPYTLFIEVFDVVHKAHVVRLASISGPPQATLVLEDPAQERKRRCLETATDVLRALHDRGVEARVVGSVGRNGPWHRGTDVDVMVMNRPVPTLMSQDPDVRDVIEGGQWRAPVDVCYSCWWSQLNEYDPFLVWSPSLGRCVGAKWSDGEQKYVGPEGQA